MRLLNWNIEWMNDWFFGGSQVRFRQDNPGRGIGDVADLARRVAQVIDQIDPDVVTVQEGPSDPREMHLFTDQYLRDPSGSPRFDVFGGVDGAAQKIYILVKQGGAFTAAEWAMDEATLALDDPWETDVDGDLHVEGYQFTRLPAVVDGEVDGQPMRIVSLHTKSKYVHHGESLWSDPNRREEFIRAAMKNRRRISAEAMRVRRYLDATLDADAQARVAVTGDFNDGPGVDFFETRYLTHNITDILLGSTFRPERLFKHAFLATVPAQDRYTAIFDDFVDNVPNRPLVLDHILVSPMLGARVVGRVAHPEYNAAIDPQAQGRQRRPSDHRPVVAEI